MTSTSNGISQGSYCRKNPINISPVKAGRTFKNAVTEYHEEVPQVDLQADAMAAHSRLREYQNSHGKSSVSKSLFKGGQTDDQKSPQSKLHSKTASAFGQNMRF